MTKKQVQVGDRAEPVSLVVTQERINAFAAVTGIERTPDELMQDGERICNLEKAINSRIGLRREHDTICERWMWEHEARCSQQANECGGPGSPQVMHERVSDHANSSQSI